MTENFKQAIERLKNNEDHIIFADMAENDQEILKQIFRECQYLDEQLRWVEKAGANFLLNGCYRIRPDYQPEPKKPEYIDLPVEKDAEDIWLGVYKNHGIVIPHGFTHLHCLVSTPDFRGFWFIRDNRCECEIVIGLVARYKREGGGKVVARFERSNDAPRITDIDVPGNGESDSGRPDDAVSRSNNL